jgi:hypothetical protein
MSFEKFETAIVSSALRAVARHWNAARGVRRIPGWTDLRPSAIAPHLPIVWSYKYDRAGDIFTGRLAGERISSIFGKNFRGIPMAEAYPSDEYPALFARSKRVVTEPAFMRGSGLVFRHLDRYGTGERIIMPLAEDGKYVDGILGATEYSMNATPPAWDNLATGELEEWYALD